MTNLTGNLEEQIAQLRDENVLLKQNNQDLRESNRLIAENVALTQQAATARDEITRISYQQAADWVKLVNSITWTLGSIFLVAAVIALNGAAQLKDQTWRPLIGVAVSLLCVFWVGIDSIYLRSARTARIYLIRIETQWGTEGFFTYQRNTPHWQRSTFLINAFLISSALVLFYLGLVAAKPWMNELLPEKATQFIVTFP